MTRNTAPVRRLLGAFALAWAGMAAAAPEPARLAAERVAASAAPARMTLSAALEGQAVAPDLAERLARYRRVHMPFDAAGLDSRTRELVRILVAACSVLDEAYWQQSDPQAQQWYRALAAVPGEEAERLRRFLRINGGRWDLIANDQPFIGSQPMPPGRSLYPPDLTRSRYDAYVQQHPQARARLGDPYTVVRRTGEQLEAVPYHTAYAAQLSRMAELLNKAAALSEDRAFAHFLELRAKALLDDDYLASDLAWLDLEDPRIDVIFAPYETYLDGLLGVKTSWGAAVLVRNEAESARLRLYQRYVAQIQDALPLPAQDRPSKAGLRTPMEVMDAPFRAGDLLHGYQAVADNLPNDPRVHEQRGSKKIFFRNFMDARVQYVILPIAAQLLRPEQATRVSGAGYLATTVMHEIAHGLGPAYARRPGGRQDIRTAIGAEYAAIEEAKADVVGLYGLAWLADHGLLTRAELEGDYISYLAGILRTVRFGVNEAHGRAEMMEFNFLLERGAITRDAAGERYAVQPGAMPAAIAALARELLEQEATGDRERTLHWLARYGSIPAHLSAALRRVRDVPVDVEPEWDFAPSLQAAAGTAGH